MACFHPITAYRLQSGEIAFYEHSGGRQLQLPCGQCTGCRIDRSKEWTMRLMHEASLHTKNCFITLTYNDEHLPSDCGLDVSHFQKFMKDLRFKYVPKNPFNKNINPKEYRKWQFKNGIRFYHCGEYGDQYNRPHYHAILFNHSFTDLKIAHYDHQNKPVYTSPTLESIWGRGFVTVGDVTPESAGYVARYCMKKINGKLADQINDKTDLKHYERIDTVSGEIISVRSEYATMSRNPGIASDWISHFTSDVYPKDYTHLKGKPYKPPRFYDKKLEAINPDLYEAVKENRLMNAYKFADDNTPERLSAREKVVLAKTSKLKRSL